MTERRVDPSEGIKRRKASEAKYGQRVANQLGMLARLDRSGLIKQKSEASALLSAARDGQSVYRWDGVLKSVFSQRYASLSAATGVDEATISRMQSDDKANLAAAADARLLAAVVDLQYTLEFREKAVSWIGRRVSQVVSGTDRAEMIAAGIMDRIERLDLPRIHSDLEDSVVVAVREEIAAQGVSLDEDGVRLLAAETLGVLDEVAEGSIGGFRGLLGRRVAEADGRAAEPAQQ